MTHKSTLDIQKIEQEKRRKQREDIREQAGAVQEEIKLAIVKKTKGNPPKSNQVRQEEGVDGDLSPMDEDSWIEHGRALQVDIPQNITPHSLSNPNQSA